MTPDQILLSWWKQGQFPLSLFWFKKPQKSSLIGTGMSLKWDSTVKTKQLLLCFIHLLSTFQLLFFYHGSRAHYKDICFLAYAIRPSLMPLQPSSNSTVLCFTQIFTWKLWKQKTWDTWFKNHLSFQVFGSMGYLALHALWNFFTFLLVLSRGASGRELGPVFHLCQTGYKTSEYHIWSFKKQQKKRPTKQKNTPKNTQTWGGGG